MAKNIITERGIYSITNVKTGKRYIGQSINITERKWQHFKELKANYHHCAYLQRSYNIHGRDSFTHDILELCEKNVINEREQYWIDYFTPTGIYNTAKVAGSPAGIKRSDETKNKISMAVKSRVVSDETRRKMSDSQAKIKEQKSSSAKAQWADPEAIRKISEKRKGRIVSEETKRRLREEMLKRWADPDYKNRLSDSQKIAQNKCSEKKSEEMKEKWKDPYFRALMQKK